MKLLIGKNIKRLRNELNLTQEEIANHLGISFQSISKWERGDGYPDIEMLPTIANYFKVSVDDLIGMSEIVESKKYDEINVLWISNNEKGLHRDNIILMKQALKLFPNDALLLVQLSTSLEKATGSDPEKANYLKDSIAVQEQILRFCPDSEIRGATLYNICFSYLKNGEHDKALEQAMKLPNLYKARENALVYFVEENKKTKIAKEALTPLAWSISHHLSILSEKNKAKQILDILLDIEENQFIKSIRKKLDITK